jgi:hypothetical protein
VHTKSHPQFPALVLTSSQEQILGLLATITSDVVPFRVYAPFPAHLPYLKCVLEVAYVKMGASQFYLQSLKKRKVGWAGDASHVAFGQNVPGEEGSARQCVGVM